MPVDAVSVYTQEHNPDTARTSPGFTDTGLTCLLIIARFHDLPADGSQLRHQFAQSGQVLSDVELLRAAKHVGLKAGLIKTTWDKIQGTPLPALAKRTDGRYVVLAKVEGEKVLIQDPIEARPLIVSREQFEATWTAELLLCAKRSIVRLQDLTFDFTWFIPAIVKYRKYFGEVLIASLFLQLFALLTPEAQVENKDVGFVSEGQPVEIKVETFQFTLYGTIPGHVLTVSDDAAPLEKVGLVYPMRVSMDRSTMRVEGKQVNLSPGMAVTVEIKTGQRRIIEYLLSPLLKSLKESLRER